MGGVAGMPVGDVSGWTYTETPFAVSFDRGEDWVAQVAWPETFPLLCLTVGRVDRQGRRSGRVVVCAIPTWLDTALCLLNGGLGWQYGSEVVRRAGQLLSTPDAAVLPHIHSLGGEAALASALAALANKGPSG
jgi:hypothetical protein